MHRSEKTRGKLATKGTKGTKDTKGNFLCLLWLISPQSRLDKFPARQDSHLTRNGKPAVCLRFPVFKNDWDSIRLADVGITHHMKVKMRLGRIAGVADLAQNIPRAHARSRLHGYSEGLQVGVVAELIVAVIDDHHVSAR